MAKRISNKNSTTTNSRQKKDDSVVEDRSNGKNGNDLSTRSGKSLQLSKEEAFKA